MLRATRECRTGADNETRSPCVPAKDPIALSLSKGVVGYVPGKLIIQVCLDGKSLGMRRTIELWIGHPIAEGILLCLHYRMIELCLEIGPQIGCRHIKAPWTAGSDDRLMELEVSQ